MFKTCCVCGRNTMCEENLILLRGLIITGCVTTGLVGYFALPLIVFDSDGVRPGSIAASWQSALGNVAADSLYSKLQSLGSKGLGSIIFNAVDMARPLLSAIAADLDWCNDENHRKTCEEQEEAEKIKCILQQIKKLCGNRHNNEEK